jgi:hypothetical protein
VPSAKPGPRNAGPGHDLDFPPTSGTISGWIGVVVSLAIVGYVVVDGHTRVGLRIGLAFALVGLVGYAYLIRPRIRVRGSDLSLLNPLEEVVIPLALVRTVSVRAATLVFVGDKRYVGVAVGRKLRQIARASVPSGSVGGLPSFLNMGAGRGISAATAQRGGNNVPDLVEEWVSTRAADAKQAGPAPGAVVRREPTWWLIAPLAVLAVGLVVSFFL